MTSTPSASHGQDKRNQHRLQRVPSHLNGRKNRRWLKRTGLTVLALAVFGTSAVGTTWGLLNSNIDQISNVLNLVNKGSVKDGKAMTLPDLNPGNPLNILILGSDSRAGNNDVDGGGKSGLVIGARSDTAMLMHIGANRKHVDVVSIPRDMLVDRPTCYLSNGREIPEQKDAMFNSAFAIGGSNGDIQAGAACAIKTVQEMSGLKIDDFIVVDFQGLSSIVNSLGGVPLYIPQNVNDPYSGLKLTKGCHVLNGSQALAWSRARHNIGDGSDLSRIKRQHDLVSAIAREALHGNLLTNPATMLGFLSSTTKSLKTGPALASVQALGGLGLSLSGLSLDQMHLLTLPYLPAGNRVVPAPDSKKVWESIKNDKPLSSAFSAGGAVNLAGSSVNAAGELLGQLEKQDGTSDGNRSANGSDGSASAGNGTGSGNNDASSTSDAAGTNNSAGSASNTRGAQPQETIDAEGQKIPICHK